LEDALPPVVSFAILADGLPLNFMPSRLHFLEGVFGAAEADVYPWVSLCEVYGGEDGFETLRAAEFPVGAD
jgi:hypothetical protein